MNKTCKHYGLGGCDLQPIQEGPNPIYKPCVPEIYCPAPNIHGGSHDNIREVDVEGLLDDLGELSEEEVCINGEMQGNVYHKKKCEICKQLKPTLMLDPEFVRIWCADCLRKMAEELDKENELKVKSNLVWHKDNHGFHVPHYRGVPKGDDE